MRYEIIGYRPGEIIESIARRKEGKTPGEVVAWLGAVQAQDFAAAKWALGLRMEKATDADVEKAFNDGAILRTHVMRPTWYFVVPHDLRSLLALTASRVHMANSHMYRKLELQDDLLSRCRTVFAKALRDRKYLTRSELAERLAENRIEAAGLRLTYMSCMPSLKRSFAAVRGEASSLPTPCWKSAPHRQKSCAAIKPWRSGRSGTLPVTG